MLDIDELADLEETMRTELDEHLLEILSKLNRSGELDDFLSLLGMRHLLEHKSEYEVFKTGTIIVLGASQVKKEKLLAAARDLGISKDRFELHLDYEETTKFDVNKLYWNPSYSLLMVGPTPHSGKGKEGFSSIIKRLESEEGFPPVVRLGSNQLKITKSNFTEKLVEAIHAGLIQCDV